MEYEGHEADVEKEAHVEKESDMEKEADMEDEAEGTIINVYNIYF